MGGNTKTLRGICKLCAFVGIAGLTSGATGHHAFSSEFDADRPFVITGTIVKVEWINPHSWVHVDVKQADDEVVSWMLEGGTPNTLLRSGLTRKVMRVGTEVIVRGYQSKDPDCDPKCRGSGRDVTFVDGRRIFMGSSGTGAPRDGSDPSEGGESVLSEQQP